MLEEPPQLIANDSSDEDTQSTEQSEKQIEVKEAQNEDHEANDNQPK